MPEWLAVCRVEEVAEGRGRSLDAGGMRLAVFRQGGELVGPVRALPALGRLARPRLDRRGRGRLSASPLAVPPGRRALHDDPRRVGAQVSLRGQGRPGLGRGLNRECDLPELQGVAVRM